MTNPKLFEEVMKPKVTVITILWGALTASMFVHLIIAYMVTGTMEPVPVDQTMLIAMYSSAAVAVLISFGIRMFAFSDDRIAEKMKVPVDTDRLGLNIQTGTVNQELKIE